VLLTIQPKTTQSSNLGTSTLIQEIWPFNLDFNVGIYYTLIKV